MGFLRDGVKQHANARGQCRFTKNHRKCSKWYFTASWCKGEVFNKNRVLQRKKKKKFILILSLKASWIALKVTFWHLCTAEHFAILFAKELLEIFSQYSCLIFPICLRNLTSPQPAWFHSSGTVASSAQHGLCPFGGAAAPLKVIPFPPVFRFGSAAARCLPSLNPRGWEIKGVSASAFLPSSLICYRFKRDRYSIVHLGREDKSVMWKLATSQRVWTRQNDVECVCLHCSPAIWGKFSFKMNENVMPKGRSFFLWLEPYQTLLRTHCT